MSERFRPQEAVVVGSVDTEPADAEAPKRVEQSPEMVETKREVEGHAADTPRPIQGIPLAL